MRGLKLTPRGELVSLIAQAVAVATICYVAILAMLVIAG